MRVYSSRQNRSRAGITLTEILISIMIMGVGLISLATLFPLGLLRLRAAARNVRSALLTETAASDLAARNLLVKSSFPGTWYGHDPLSQDPLDPAAPVFNINLASPFSVDGGTFRANAVPGLPICYDPLWRQLAGVKPRVPTVTGAATIPEARFASGIGFLRTDPDGSAPSGFGLQRLTNLPVLDQWGTSLASAAPNPAKTASDWLQMVGDVFASQDDLVYQTASPNVNASKGQGNPLAVDLSTTNPFTTLPTPMADWSYTWMFTGSQSESGTVVQGSALPEGASAYTGNVVVFHNRSFGIENGVPNGERVVEAIWGYSTNTTSFPTAAGIVLYPNGDNRQVLLRWPANQPDPDVRQGGWIADVTYERRAAFDQGASARFAGTLSSGQRCFWYRIARKTSPEAETKGFATDPNVAFRRMIVTLDSPVQAKTALMADAGVGLQPRHVEAAFISPFVVNVFPVSVNPR
jgi:hypothetical protein